MTDTDTARPVPPKAKAKAAKAKANGHPVATFDRLRSKKGMVRKVPVYLDPEALEEYTDARDAHALLDSMPTGVVSGADRAARAARLAAATAALEATTMTVVLSSPRVTTDDDPPRHLKGRLAYEWLQAQHPPTPEDNAKHKEEHGIDAPYDADTFAPALVAACSREPEMTAEQVSELFEEWTFAEVMALFTAAMEVSNGSSVGDLGKGFGTMAG